MGLRAGQPLYGIKFEQKPKNENYVNHLYEIMEPYVGTPPEKRVDPSTNETKSVWFRTYRHDDFIFYFNLFYKIEEKGGGKISVKVVPNNIHKVLNARVLAYWFMDDGSLSGGGEQYYLNTQGFQKHEVIRLCEALKQCFGIKASEQKDGKLWRIYINAESNRSFEQLIIPYLHEIFFYKIRAAYRPQES